MTDSPHPLVLSIDGGYILWLRTNSAPGSRALSRGEIDAYLADEGIGEAKRKSMLDRAVLHGSSDPAFTVDDAIADASRHHPMVRAPADLLAWADRP